MRIAVIGAGYVGLTTAACLAEIGHGVVCAENDAEKLAALQSGAMPLFEPHLGGLVTKNREEGRLEFGPTEFAVATCNAIFICVGTPLGANGEVDLSSVAEVARAIRGHAHGTRLVVQKSTVPVGSCGELEKLLAQKPESGFGNNGHAPLRCDVVANPEFLREGLAVHDFLHPDRIVIGAENLDAAEAVKEIYRPIIERNFECPIHRVGHSGETAVPVVIADTQSAELIKHTANSFLAMKISFINMVSDLCEAVGGDVEKVAHGIGLDHRIGPAFLKAGIGFGGSCFPKDVQGFIQAAEKHGCDFALLKEVEKINRQRVERFVGKVNQALLAGAVDKSSNVIPAKAGIDPGRRGTACCALAGKIIAVWGLAFKPDTDDVRNSQAIAIARRLIEEGAEIRAYDPKAMENARREAREINYCEDMYAVTRGADALLILTDWPEFRDADFDLVRSLMRQPVMLDGQNARSARQAMRRAASAPA